MYLAASSRLFLDTSEALLANGVPCKDRICLVSSSVSIAHSHTISFIQGVGGTVQYPKGFVKEAFKATREKGGLCISDEVQTGFGRLGTHFWGFESHNVTPDIGK